MLADQPAAESGMEHSGVAPAGVAFLVGNLHMVVYWWAGRMGPGDPGGHEADGMGSCLWKTERPSQGKQKPLFCKNKKESVTN